MPSKQSDPACYSKKLHIGNNFVTIVYNDSKKPYQFGTIKVGTFAIMKPKSNKQDAIETVWFGSAGNFLIKCFKK